MICETFRKVLSANDIGLTGGHQAGILIPKRNAQLLRFLPQLDRGVKNPDAWLLCIDDDGENHRFRFVYYNNKFHDARGTRDEYRLTHMTTWLRHQEARVDDSFEIRRRLEEAEYRIRIVRHETLEDTTLDDSGSSRIRLRGWRRVH